MGFEPIIDYFLGTRTHIFKRIICQFKTPEIPGLSISLQS